MVYGRIYTIRSHQTPNIYIGSTTQILCKRMSDHHRDYKRYLNGLFGCTSSYEILQYTDAYIELLFEGEFESKNALQKKEGEYIREMNCVNKVIPGRSSQEYYKDNKEHIVEYQQEWRKNHKEQMTEMQKKWYEKNKEEEIQKKKVKYTCECGTICRKGDKVRHERTEKHKKLMLCLCSEESSF